MGRVGLMMALLALITVALASLIPVIGALLVAPLTAAVVGAGAGWWASKVLGYGTVGRGAGAGAIAGIGALIGSVIGLLVLGSIVGRSPEFQRAVQQGVQNAQQQNPGATVPNLNAGTLAAAGGAVGGFCFGLFDLFLSVIGGMIAGAVYGRNRGAAATAATTSTAAIYPSMTAAPGGMSGDAPQTAHTTQTDDERNARIYPDKQ